MEHQNFQLEVALREYETQARQLIADGDFETLVKVSKDQLRKAYSLSFDSQDLVKTILLRDLQNS